MKCIQVLKIAEETFSVLGEYPWDEIFMLALEGIQAHAVYSSEFS